MTRKVGLLFAAIALGAVSVLGVGGSELALTDSQAGAATAANCSGGVIVAADFSTWGKGVHRVCDTPLPSNAAQALVNGGFHPHGVTEYPGLDFICTISGYPQNEDCNSTPPADAYWSFWYADTGHNTWSYSPLGAANLSPSKGSVEGWVFGGDSASHPPPGFPSPNAMRNTFLHTSPSSTTTTSPKKTGGSSSPSTTAPMSAKKGVSATSSTIRHSEASTTLRPAHTVPAHKGPTKAPPKKSGGKAGPTGSTSKDKKEHGSPLTTGAPSPGGHEQTVPKIVDAAPAVASQPAMTSPLPFVIGSLVILLVGGTAALVTWRRREADGG